MKFMRSSRECRAASDGGDPMGGLANLFDVAVVFIAALLLALMSVFDAKELFDRDSSFTVIKRNDRGEMTLIRKEGRRMKAVKMTREEAAGRGVRLGTAYRLEDGSMIYVPEE